MRVNGFVGFVCAVMVGVATSANGDTAYSSPGDRAECAAG